MTEAPRKAFKIKSEFTSSGKEFLLPVFVNKFFKVFQPSQILKDLFLPWQLSVRAMTRFILLETLTHYRFVLPEADAGWSCPQSPREAPATAPQQDRPPPARAVPQVQGVWQPQGTPAPALLVQGVPWAEVLPAPPCMPATSKMFLALTPGSGQGAELGAPWQEVLWTSMAKSTICRWLAQHSHHLGAGSLEYACS